MGKSWQEGNICGICHMAYGILQFFKLFPALTKHAQSVSILPVCSTWGHQSMIKVTSILVTIILCPHESFCGIWHMAYCIFKILRFCFQAGPVLAWMKPYWQKSTQIHIILVLGPLGKSETEACLVWMCNMPYAICHMPYATKTCFYWDRKGWYCIHAFVPSGIAHR